MAFKLDSKELNDTATLHLKDPETGSDMYEDDAETKPLTITVYGRGSRKYRDALAEVQRVTIKRGNKKVSLQEQMDDNAKFLAAVSKSAENLELNEAPLDSKETFLALYSNPKLVWVREQVDAFLQDTASFLAK